MRSRTKATFRDGARPMPTSRRSGSTRRDRPACQRACGICMPVCRRPPNLCHASARHPRGRRLPLGGKTVFRLRPRQRPDISDVGRRHARCSMRSGRRRRGCTTDEPVQSEHLLRRADAVRGDAERRGGEKRARRHAAADLHLGRRSVAGIGRQCLEGALRRRHPRWRRLDRTAAHLPVECAGRHQIRHVGPSGAGLQGAAGR